MAARLVPGTSLRVRRACRPDLAQVQRLLVAPAGDRLERFQRRMLADSRSDVYVAEELGGEIVGVVAVVYVRSLASGRLSALLDAAYARPPTGPVLEALVAVAEERARRRGCRRLGAHLGDGAAELRATLVARGYRGDECLVSELAGSG